MGKDKAKRGEATSADIILSDCAERSLREDSFLIKSDGGEVAARFALVFCNPKGKEDRRNSNGGRTEEPKKGFRGGTTFWTPPKNHFGIGESEKECKNLEGGICSRPSRYAQEKVQQGGGLQTKKKSERRESAML